jgi:hypothetical protein
MKQREKTGSGTGWKGKPTGSGRRWKGKPGQTGSGRGWKGNETDRFGKRMKKQADRQVREEDESWHRLVNSMENIEMLGYRMVTKRTDRLARMTDKRDRLVNRMEEHI